MAQRRPAGVDQATKKQKPASDEASLDPTLLEWDQLPNWQRDNEHILSGYRPASFSFWRCLESALEFHNETVNIHSHLLGAVLFFSLPYVSYRHFSLHGTPIQLPDIIVLSTFFFGVAICFLLSSTFHTFANHSPRVNTFGNQLDYLGIVILMWGSTIPSVYYGFYCDPGLQKRYWTVVSVLAIACVVATLDTRFRHPALRPYRALVYSGLGLSALGFVSHGLFLHGWEIQNGRMSLDWMGLMTVLNLTGATAYAVRLPEKLAPRKFDIIGNSHQILHVMVILAALAHMFGLFRAFGHVHSSTFTCQ
jgi:adiponectin receptor